MAEQRGQLRKEGAAVKALEPIPVLCPALGRPGGLHFVLVVVGIESVQRHRAGIDRWFRANSKVPGNNCSASATGGKQGWLATGR